MKSWTETEEKLDVYMRNWTETGENWNSKLETGETGENLHSNLERGKKVKNLRLKLETGKTGENLHTKLETGENWHLKLEAGKTCANWNWSWSKWKCNLCEGGEKASCCTVLFAGLIYFFSFALGSCTGERIRDRWDQKVFLAWFKKYFLLDSKSISCLIKKVFLAWFNHSSRTSACSIHYYCYWICNQHNQQYTFSQGCTYIYCTRVYKYESLGGNLTFDAQIENEYIWTPSVWIESWHRFWMQGMDWCNQDGKVPQSTFHSKW